MAKYTQAQLRELETIGCDLGDQSSRLFGIRPDESTWAGKPIPTTREGFSKFFSGRARAHVVIEAGTHSRWVAQELESVGHVVTVANPRKVKLISQNTRKSDKRDPQLLARLGRADVELLAPIEHRGDAAQADLAILKARDVLVSCRTKLVNQARGLVKSFGYRLPRCDADYFHRHAGQAVPEALRPALGPVITSIEAMTATIKAYDKQIEALAKDKYPDVDVISQPSGVGVLTALAFMLTIEDKHRFAKSRDVGAFLGLCPAMSQSGDDDPQLRIAKTGDGFLRRLLVQAAHYALGHFGTDSDLRRWGQQMCKRGGNSAKKRARVAVARKLAVLMHRLWVTGEVYEPIGYRQNQLAQRKSAA